MKVILAIIIVNILLLSSCKSKEIEQSDNTNKILSQEDNNKYYYDSSYHIGLAFQPGEYYLLSNTTVYESLYKYSTNIGNLNIHEKILIIEDVHNQQFINNTHSCWYKIKYNNSFGYIFGGNIAKDTFICDIDGNGITDYFQYRISNAITNYHIIDTRKDIIIYINNNKINTNNLNKGINKYGNILYDFNSCSFELINNEVLIKLAIGTPDYVGDYVFFESDNISFKRGGYASVENYIFSMDRLGNISLKNYYKEDKFVEY